MGEIRCLSTNTVHGSKLLGLLLVIFVQRLSICECLWTAGNPNPSIQSEYRRSRRYWIGDNPGFELYQLWPIRQFRITLDKVAIDVHA